MGPVVPLPLAAAAPGTDWTLLAVVAGVSLAFVAAVVAGVRAYRRPFKVRQPAVFVTGDLHGIEDLTPPESPILTRLEKVLLFALGGYLFFDRGFAWLHIPGTPAFIGELVIVFGVLALIASRPRLGRVAHTSGAFKALLGYMAWGALLLAGAVTTYSLDAVRDAALWYYGIVAVFVVALALSRPGRVNAWLRLFGKTVPYALIWFPIATIIDSGFSDKFPKVPGSQVSVVAHRSGNIAVMSAVAIGFIWLVDRDREMFNQRQRVFLTSLGTLVILFSAMRNRGGFVAAAVGLGIAFLFLRRKRTEITMIMVGAVVLLLLIGLLGNVRVPLFEEREVSVEQLLTNLASVIDQDSGGNRQASTTAWRLEIWGQVLSDVSSDFPLTGFGPGPDLGEVYNITTNPDVPLRNPHNSHVGVLARSGFVGATLWFMIWSILAAELLMTRSRLLARGRYREAGVTVWVLVTVPTILVNAVFDPTLEGPQVAWWLWAMLGLGVSVITLERTGRLPEFSLREERSPTTSRRARAVAP